MTDSEQPPDKGRAGRRRPSPPQSVVPDYTVLEHLRPNQEHESWISRILQWIPLVIGVIWIGAVIFLAIILYDPEADDSAPSEQSCEDQYGYRIYGAQSEEERIGWENSYISCLDARRAEERDRGFGVLDR